MEYYYQIQVSEPTFDFFANIFWIFNQLYHQLFVQFIVYILLPKS